MEEEASRAGAFVIVFVGGFIAYVTDKPISPLIRVQIFTPSRVSQDDVRFSSQLMKLHPGNRARQNAFFSLSNGAPALYHIPFFRPVKVRKTETKKNRTQKKPRRNSEGENDDALFIFTSLQFAGIS